MTALYDRIGSGYAGFRRPDPRIETAIWGALGSADSIVNVGAGAGSYEPTDRYVVAVEPSMTMIAQRPAGGAAAVQAMACALPFETDGFDAALAILTVHHWRELAKGLQELRRAAWGNRTRPRLPLDRCQRLTHYCAWKRRDPEGDVCKHDVVGSPHGQASCC